MDATLVKKLNCAGVIDEPLAVILPNKVNTVDAGIFKPPIAYVTSVLLPSIIRLDPLIDAAYPIAVELLKLFAVDVVELPINVLLLPVVIPDACVPTMQLLEPVVND